MTFGFPLLSPRLRAPERACLIVAAVLGPLASHADATVIEWPPVVASAVTHSFDGRAVDDDVSTSGADCRAPGGTITLGTGDTVRIRVQAPPPGRLFHVHPDPRSGGAAIGARAIPSYVPPRIPELGLVTDLTWLADYETSTVQDSCTLSFTGDVVGLGTATDLRPTPIPSQ